MRSHVRATLIAAAATIGASAPACAAAVADDRAVMPLERGAFVAMPAVYDLLADLRVEALVVDGRRVPINRGIPIKGTAFGVAPGRVIAARHVVAPTPKQLVDEIVAVTGLAGIPSDPARVRIVGLRRTLSLVGARTAVGGAIPATQPIAAKLGRYTDEEGDLALLEITDLDAPTLALDDTLTRGTPVATIGFGGQPTAIPAVRLGTLDGPRRIEDTDNDGFGAFDGAVLRGDSGAPVVDVDGRAHGVVLRLRTNTAPVIARAEAVRRLLEADDATSGESPVITDFRTAMLAFWRRDYPSAAKSLSLLNDANPNVPLVRQQHARATALVDSGYELRRPSPARRAILAIGVMATLTAAALGALRIRRQPLLP
jgi:hypothetical protein